MKHYLLFALIAFSSSSVQAEQSKLTIELTWRNLPRTDPQWTAYQEADLPNDGRIVWVARTNGYETLSIQFKQGFSCSTSDDRAIALLCSCPAGSWSAFKPHNKPTQMEWIEESIPVKGDKS